MSHANPSDEDGVVGGSSGPHSAGDGPYGGSSGTDRGGNGMDLGAALRALRRAADLSQRELAERSDVPASTLARIEAGSTWDPRIRTVERLVAGAGGTLVIARPGAADLNPGNPGLSAPAGAGAQMPAGAEPSGGAEAPMVVDAAGRRFPAHLDVRRVVEAKDWWGAWWANWYALPRHRWPRPAPDHTFDLSRERRDWRRRRAADAARVEAVRVERRAGLPETIWQWVATDPDSGEPVGTLAGFVRQRRSDQVREFVICDIEVAPGWRRIGLGRRLIDVLRAELADRKVRQAQVLLEEPELPMWFFVACGFFRRGPQPERLTVFPERR